MSEAEFLVQRIEGLASESSEERERCEEDFLRLLPKLDSNRLVDLIGRAYSSEVVRTARLLDGTAKALMPFVPRIGSGVLVKLLVLLAGWAVTVGPLDSEGRPRVSENLRGFLMIASAELVPKLMDITSRDLGHIAGSLSSLGIAEERLFMSIARTAVARSERAAPEDIVAVARSLAQVGLLHPELFVVAARALRLSAPSAPVSELAQGLKALASCSLQDAAMAKAVGDSVQQALAQDPSSASPDDLASICWSFCALGSYHGSLFRASLRALGASAGGSSPPSPEAASQLFEVYLLLKALRPDVLTALPEELLETARAQHRKRAKEATLERASEKLHKDLAEALRDATDDSVVRQLTLPDVSLVVDLAVVRRRSEEVLFVVEVDGPHSMLRTPDAAAAATAQPGAKVSQVRGSVLLKRRLLQLLGFRVAVVSEELLRSLSDSGRGRRDFAKELLKSLSGAGAAEPAR